MRVAIDVVGIFDDHHHDDRYYTETAIESDAMFLHRAPIVLMHPTSDIEDHSSGDTSSSLGHDAHIGPGYANLGITGPVSIGGVSYRLDSVEYCIENLDTADVTLFQIWREGPAPATSIRDETDRTTERCHTVAGETGDVAFAYVIQWLVAGTGQLRVTGLRSTWAPIT